MPSTQNVAAIAAVETIRELEKHLQKLDKNYAHVIVHSQRISDAIDTDLRAAIELAAAARDRVLSLAEEL